MVYKSIILVFIFFFCYTFSAKAGLVFDRNEMVLKIINDTSSSKNYVSASDDAGYETSRGIPAYASTQESSSSPVIEKPVEVKTSDGAQRKTVYFDDDNDYDVVQNNKKPKFDDTKPQAAARSVANTESKNDDSYQTGVYAAPVNTNPTNGMTQQPNKDTVMDTNYVQQTNNDGDNGVVFAQQKKYDDDVTVKPYQGIKVIPVPARRPKQNYYCDYVVKPTDNLSIIGRHFNATVDEIAIAMEIDPRKQKPEVGKTYRIPVLPYLVGDNDTIDTIATKNNVKAIEIKAVNHGVQDIKPNNIILLPIIDRSKIDLSNMQVKKTDVVSKPLFIWPASNIVSVNKEKDGGVTILSSKKNDIVAIGNGVVVYVGDKIKKYTKLVIIKHDGGYISAYGYLDNVTVQNNDLVIAGQSIGQTAKLSLYFTLKKDKMFVDPADYLPKK